MANPTYGDIVICTDPKSPWYARMGRVVGKNKENLGVAFEGDPDPPRVGRWIRKTAAVLVGEIEIGESPTIQAIQLRDVRVGGLKGLTIPIAPSRHLILTGRNGTGKTTILSAIVAALLDPAAQHGDPPCVLLEFDGSPLAAMAGLAMRSWLVSWLPVDRGLRPVPVSGPTGIDWAGVAATGASPAGLFPQYLVNRRFDILNAREDGRADEADQIATWFNGFQDRVRLLFEESELVVSFDRLTYRFTFDYPDGRKVGFNELPDGFSSILAIWGELHLRCEAWRELHPGKEMLGGFVVIDELETHLHLSLQSRLFPFLTTMFPTFQFIVSTHSPAVLASVEDAMIFDLETLEPYPSKELVGFRYGTIVTGSFGMESDYPVKTTEDLRRLKEMLEREKRSPEEDVEMRRLADDLRARSPTLAFQVWSMLDEKEDRQA